MRSETVPEGMTTRRLFDRRPFDGRFDGFLQVLLRNVMPACLVRARVGRRLGCRENVLSGPGAACVAILALQSEWEVDTPTTSFQIPLVDFLDAFQMNLERAA